MLFAAIFFGWPALDAAGDRIVFEAQRARYAVAIAKLETGESPDVACPQFRFRCGVSRRQGLRVAFDHPEFFDKHIGYVYDPSGVYASIGDRERDDAFYKEFAGELLPGVVMSCRPFERSLLPVLFLTTVVVAPPANARIMIF